MRILRIDESPLFTVRHRSADHDRGRSDAALPAHRVVVDALPAGLQAVFVTSDLQGRAVEPPHDGALLGVAVAEAVLLHCWSRGLAPESVGVLLGGDLFADEDVATRGGRGDARAVWRAFAAHFAFAAGVAGNHDAFGEPAGLDAFAGEPGMHLLDSDTPGLAMIADCAGLCVAGVSGIVGKPTKPWRKERQAFLDGVARALAARPDVLVLHQNPALPGVARGEFVELTAMLAERCDGVVAFGHSFSAAPLHELGSAQLLATEGRAFWLEAAGRSEP